MSLRVLHLLRSFQVGGLESVVVSLVNGLSLAGVECHLGCLVEAGEWRDRAAAKSVWVGRLEQRWRLPVVLGLSRHLRRQNIGLIHSHNSQAHLYGVAASLLTGIPLVHTKHGQNWPDDPWWVWKSRQASRLSRCIVAVSDDIARIVTDIERVPRGKVSVIRNGIDMERFSPECGTRNAECGVSEVRKKLGIPANVFVVGSVGRLAWEKNYELLVRAFGQFHRRAPGSLLVIVGEGPYRDRIQQAAVAAGVADACRLPGQSDDVAVWLQAMDVFCLSSLTEGTSITLLEAGAAGLPAIVTDVGGNAEVVVAGVTGLVVPSLDERALAQAMELLAADRGQRDHMGAAARARVIERYSVDGMVNAYANLYRSVLSREGLGYRKNEST